MKTVLYTQNNSLYNLWTSYAFDDKVSITTSKNELLKLLNLKSSLIVGIDLAAFENAATFVKDTISKNNQINILVLANEPKFENGKLFLALGSKGYANSHMQEVHFKDAINTIASGNIWLYPEFVQSMILEMNAKTIITSQDDVNLFNTLSNKEKEIAYLIQKGLSNKDISETTGITIRTVKAHTTSIYNKMGVKDRIGLVLSLQKNG